MGNSNFIGPVPPTHNRTTKPPSREFDGFGAPICARMQTFTVQRKFEIRKRPIGGLFGHYTSENRTTGKCREDWRRTQS